MHLVSLCNHGVVPNAVCCSGTERARGMAQTLLNVPYGEGDGEKLDVYIPNINSLGTCIVAPHTVILQVQSWYRINRPHPLSFRCPPCCLHTWRLLAVSQVCAVAGISTFLTIIRFLGHSFWVFVVTQQRGVWVHGCSAH